MLVRNSCVLYFTDARQTDSIGARQTDSISLQIPQWVNFPKKIKIKAYKNIQVNICRAASKQRHTKRVILITEDKNPPSILVLCIYNTNVSHLRSLRVQQKYTLKDRSCSHFSPVVFCLRGAIKCTFTFMVFSRHILSREITFIP